jgi:amino acid adenylation domain-containing protein
MLVAILGVLKAGCWYVPIALGEPALRAERMLRVAGARYVIADDGVVEPVAALNRIDVPRTPAGDVLLDLPPVDPEQPVYVMFTSGSSGEPKGVEVNSASVVNRIRWGTDYLGLRSDDRILQKTPYTFDVAGWEFFCPLVVGATCVFLREAAHSDPAAVAAAIAADEITACHFVPTMLADFLRVAAADQVAGVRIVCCSGEALPARLCHEFHRVFTAELHNLYGPTEAAIDVAAWRVPLDIGPDDPVYIGGPTDNAILRVVDESGVVVPRGETGELWIGGRPVANGYVGRPDLTAAAFPTVDGRRYYRTGDLVRVVDGLLEYQGRRDGQVKVSGVRVEVGEVESAIMTHEAVGQAHVVALTSNGLTELHAVLLDAPGAVRPTVTALTTHLATRLPRAYLPHRVWWFDQIPLLSSGKADRAALRAEISRRTAAEEEDGDPVGQAWRRALGVTSADDGGFLSLGGHSLSALRLVAALRNASGVEIPVSVLLSGNASLADLRAAFDAAAAAGPVPAPDAPRETTGPIPLTPGQRTLWRVARLHGGAAPYNVVGALFVSGSVDVPRLRRAVDQLVERYLCLRVRVVDGDTEHATFEESDVRPVLRVLDTDAAAAADDFVRRVGLEVIDPDTGPVAIVTLLRGVADACLVISIHHMLADQATLDVLVGDLGLLYVGEAPPAVETGFGRYAARVLAYPHTAASGADLEYWAALLADVPAEPTMPFVRRPTEPRSLTSHGERWLCGAELSQRIDGFCRTNGITAFTLVVSCLARVLSAWTGRATVVLGMPVSQRREAGDDAVGGYLLNTVPLCVEVDPRASAVTLLGHVRQRLTEALVHSGTGLEGILDTLGIRPSPLQNPLFQVWVNDLTQAAEPAFGGLAVQPVRPSPYVALFDVNLYLRRDAGHYEVDIVGASETADLALPGILRGQLAELLTQILDDPSPPLGELALSRPGSARPAPAPSEAAAGLLERLLAMAGERPHATALLGLGQPVTYGELRRRMETVAAKLGSAGVREGSVVALVAHRHPDLVSALLAAWSVEAAPALINAAHPDEFRGGLLRVLDPVAVLTVGAEGGADVSRFGGAGTAVGRGHILCTSGTGGESAAVYVPYEILSAQLAWLLELNGLADSDRTGLLAGIGHDPMFRDLLPLAVGGTTVVPADAVLRDPLRLCEFVRDSGITVLHATPALLELLVAGADETQQRYPSLRLIMSGGAPLTAGLADRIRVCTGARLINAYGTTETPQIASWQDVTTLSASASEEVLPFGTGAPGGPLLVLDEFDRDCGPGQLGEVVVCSRYLGEYVTPDRGGFADGLGGWPGRVFRTGDLGRRDAAGNVVIAGRRDRQILVNGFRGSIEEIERVALRHSGVRRAAAAFRQTELGDVVELRVVPEPGHVVLREHLDGFLRHRLPRHLVPSVILVAATLATDHNHKVNLRGASVPEDSPVSAGLGRDPGVAELNRLVEPVLGSALAPQANFFEAGFNSIMLLRFHQVLTTQTGRSIPITVLFANPTLTELAAWLAGSADPLSSPAEVREGHSSRCVRAERRRAVRAELMSDHGGERGH